MHLVRKYLNKLKKKDVEETEEPEERFDEDAAATILSLLRKQPEDEMLKPYYEHSELMLQEFKDPGDTTSLKRSVSTDQKKSLLGILKGQEEKETRRSFRINRGAILKILNE